MIGTVDYICIIRELIKIINEWCDDPKACGCDTFECMGTCLAVRSRDVVQEAMNIINDMDIDI